LAAQGYITPEQSAHYKKRIIEKWLESAKGLPREDEPKHLP